MLTTNIIPHLHQSTDTGKERGMGGGRERAGRGRRVMLLSYTKFSKPDCAINQNGQTDLDFKSSMGSDLIVKYITLQKATKFFCAQPNYQVPSDHTLRVMGPRFLSLCSTILIINSSWEKTVWKTVEFLFCSTHTRYFKTTIQKQLV